MDGHEAGDKAASLAGAAAADDHQQGAALLAAAEAWRRQAEVEEKHGGDADGGYDGDVPSGGEGFVDAVTTASAASAAATYSVGVGLGNDGAEGEEGEGTNRGSSAGGSSPSSAGAAAQPMAGFGVNSRRAAEWQNKLRELLAYKKEHGDCRVPKDFAENPSLAMWCDNQRRQNKLREQGKKSSMTDERVAALNEVGFWWGWRIVPFEDRVEELKKFRDEHGTCRVTNADGPEHHGLRDWLKAQRERYHAGLLGEDRKNVLEEVGFQFGARMPKWEDHFDMLLKYKEKHGHCNVSKEDEDEHGDLVRWVKRQRALYTARIRGGIATGGDEDAPPKAAMAARTKDFGLTDERLVKLEEVGFLFNAWDVKYSELVQYKETYGALPDVPLNVDSARKYARQDGVDNGQLVRWLANQRKNYPAWLAGRDTPLTDDRVVRLLKLDFDFEPPEAKADKAKADSKESVESTWKKQLGVLRAYKEMYGHCDVPHNFGMNRDLANWVQACRTEYRALKEGKGKGKGKGKDGNHENSTGITEKLAEELRELGLSLTKEDEYWNVMLRELITYGEKHGTTFVEPGDKKNAALRQWMAGQRKQFHLWQDGKDSTMTENRIALMEEANFSFEGEVAEDKTEDELVPSAEDKTEEELVPVAEDKTEEELVHEDKGKKGKSASAKRKSRAIKKGDGAIDGEQPTAAAAYLRKKADWQKRGSATPKPPAKKEEDDAGGEAAKPKASARKKKKDEADSKPVTSKASAKKKKKDGTDKEAVTPRSSARKKKKDETDGEGAATTPRSSARKKKDETTKEAATPRTSARKKEKR